MRPPAAAGQPHHPPGPGDSQVPVLVSSDLSGMIMSGGQSNKLTTGILFQGILAFGNYYALFKLTRDYLILSKIYKAEKLLIERFSASFQS